jgi:hypothetical protein
MNNLYWNIYKNLENELLEISKLIHIDDKQLCTYSIKIAELLLRTVVEIESISKSLYFSNGGDKQDDNDLYFDTDCINLLETKWNLSKKVIYVSSINFYLSSQENLELKPLKKANKRGSSSSDWKKAYQAIKHNRSSSLESANLKNLIRALGALFILNIYYNDTDFEIQKDFGGLSFDRNLGSSIFSIKLLELEQMKVTPNIEKNDDFFESIYYVSSTNDTTKKAIDLMQNLVLQSQIENTDLQSLISKNNNTVRQTLGNVMYEALLNKN